MTYLPNAYTHETAFPTAYGKDVLLQLKMIESLYTRHYPLIQYRTQRVRPMPAPGLFDPEGQSGDSIVDPLWNEVLPPTLQGESWEQPHLSGTHVASEPRVENPAYPLHARVQLVNIELELKKTGVEPRRSLDMYIPTLALDRAGITAKQGDRFSWDNDEFQVLSADPVGYWKNTNIRFYVKFQCIHARSGS